MFTPVPASVAFDIFDQLFRCLLGTAGISCSEPANGLTINPVNSEVYIADAIDYVQNGVVLRYSPDGELLDEFYVGIIPGAFCWR